MRFVAVKSEDAQASGVVFRARDVLVRQRTQVVNSLRGDLAEYGFITAQGSAYVASLIECVVDNKNTLPDAARSALAMLIETLRDLEDRVRRLDHEIARRAREDEDAQRLATIPGVGPITATALIALAPAASTFKKGRDFAAWLGLAPLQRSTGGKQKLGATSKMGERTLRRLLILGASSVVRQAADRGVPEGSWLGRMLARKPRMLVIVALANKLARIIWALLAKGGSTELRSRPNKSVANGVEGVGGTKGRYGARSIETGLETRRERSASEHALMIWNRSANSHTGPRHLQGRIGGRTDVSTRLRAKDQPENSLALTGVSTDVHRPISANTRRPAQYSRLVLACIFLSRLCAKLGYQSVEA